MIDINLKIMNSKSKSKSSSLFIFWKGHILKINYGLQINKNVVLSLVLRNTLLR